MPAASLTRAVELPQGAAKGLDFVFVGVLLPFSHFDGLEHLFHLVNHLAEGVEDLIDVVDGLPDACGGSRLQRSLGGRAVRPALRRGRPVSRSGGSCRLSPQPGIGFGRFFGGRGGLELFARLGLLLEVGLFGRLKLLVCLRLDPFLRLGGLGRLLGGGFSGLFGCGPGLD
jgi:hypothetical protein